MDENRESRILDTLAACCAAAVFWLWLLVTP